MTPIDRNVTRQLVLGEAESWIGTPYRHQGSSKGVGCDCLGLVRGVWRSVCGPEPEQPGNYAPDWAEAGGRDLMLEAARRHFVELPESDARPGDLLIFRWRQATLCKHAGILADGDRFIHAYQGHAVLASPLVWQWQNRIAAVFSFPNHTKTGC